MLPYRYLFFDFMDGFVEEDGWADVIDDVYASLFMLVLTYIDGG